MAIYSYSISIFACDEDKEYSYVGIVPAEDVASATLSISKYYLDEWNILKNLTIELIDDTCNIPVIELPSNSNILEEIKNYLIEGEAQ